MPGRQCLSCVGPLVYTVLLLDLQGCIERDLILKKSMPAGITPSPVGKTGQSGSRAQSLRQTSSFGSAKYTSLPSTGVVSRDALRASLAKQVSLHKRKSHGETAPVFFLFWVVQAVPESLNFAAQIAAEQQDNWSLQLQGLRSRM